MSLLGLLDYEDSTSSSSDSDESQEKHVTSRNADNCNKDTQENSESLCLPSPNLDGNSTNSRTFQQSSVFYNPFKAEEKKKLDVLEKHVQLSKTTSQTQNSKRVCYKFQKGKCRYGDKCRFAHSSSKPIKTGSSNNKSDDLDGIQGLPHVNKQCTQYEVVNEDDDCLDTANRSKRRRVGVSDSLVPPKRALKNFEQIKQKQNT